MVQDDDGHWFVIPVQKGGEFDKALIEQDWDTLNTAPWAVRVGGSPSLVIFPEYEIQ